MSHLFSEHAPTVKAASCGCALPSGRPRRRPGHRKYSLRNCGQRPRKLYSAVVAVNINEVLIAHMCWVTCRNYINTEDKESGTAYKHGVWSGRAVLGCYLQTRRVPGPDATLLEMESNGVETRFLNSAASWSVRARRRTHLPPGL